MNLFTVFLASWAVATSAIAAPVVLLESPVRVVAESQLGPTSDKTRLKISVQHDGSEFELNLLQRGTASAALASQKATSGWKDDHLFVRDDCLSDNAISAGWRCVVDHVFTLVEDTRDKSRKRLIYVGDVFAGEECIETNRIGCAIYKGVFTDIYDWLEENALAPPGESPAILIESTVVAGVFTVDLEQTWRANQERYQGGTKCLQAKVEMQRERCIDGITPRRAYLFNTALATYTRHDEQLARTRAYARTALCDSRLPPLTDAECSAKLRAAALFFNSIKPGETPRPRGKVMSRTARQK